jgi:hypothetical protein
MGAGAYLPGRLSVHVQYVIKYIANLPRLLLLMDLLLHSEYGVCLHLLTPCYGV